MLSTGEPGESPPACEATADSAATARPNSNGPPTNQSGLVNVLLDDILVQVPISVAANVCDVNVAVLAQLDDTAEARDATAESVASPGTGPAAQVTEGQAAGSSSISRSTSTSETCSPTTRALMARPERTSSLPVRGSGSGEFGLDGGGPEPGRENDGWDAYCHPGGWA
jgi:hypothetical protein